MATGFIDSYNSLLKNGWFKRKERRSVQWSKKRSGIVHFSTEKGFRPKKNENLQTMSDCFLFYQTSSKQT